MAYSEWIKLFGSFRFLAAVILSSAILTSVAFTAAPEYHATGTGHHSVQPVVDIEASRSVLP